MTKGWNHRVIATKHLDGIYFGIHEVDYDDRGNPASASISPMEVSAESVESLHWFVDRMKECLEQPVLIFTQTGKMIEYKPEDNESND